MEKKKPPLPIIIIIIIIFFSFISFSVKSASGADDCRPASCDDTGPEVRFPFRLLGRQPPHCGFSGFDLSCNELNQTILHIPSSNPHIVNKISYVSQSIYIDPQFCRPKRIADFNLSGTPFDFSILQSYTFYNCSSQNFGFMYPAVPFPCLSGANFTVIAVRIGLLPAEDMLTSCQDFTTISVPIRWYDDIREQLELMWFRPYCRSCEMEGRACGLKSDDGETDCLGSSRGIPRSAKYGLSIGIGVPALICIVGLVCYTATRVRQYNHSRRHRIDLFSIAITPQPPSSTGLDGPTINSYPKTVLGESCRLPKDDGTCPICLSDYKPKESLRTIPECNHYFHADCIDEWLKLNPTCPVCRNSPESSSLVTPCSSSSSNSSDSS